MSEWISVTERLPKSCGSYLVRYKQDHKNLKEIQIIWFVKEKNEFEFFHDLVTHWMPLPQPPKGE